MFETIFIWLMFFLLGIGILIFIWLAYFTEIGRAYMRHQAMCSPYHCVCQLKEKKMNKQTEAKPTMEAALKMAIEAMSCISQSRGDPLLKAINACKEALEQPAEEPVAWMNDAGDVIPNFVREDWEGRNWEVAKGFNIPLYTHPHQWQGLTDDEIDAIKETIDYGCYPVSFARAIEQSLKEKNNVNS